MGSVASPFPNPIASGLKGAAARPTATASARRVGQRRQMLAVQAASSMLSSLVLLVYSYAGTIAAAYIIRHAPTSGFAYRIPKPNAVPKNAPTA